MIFEKYITGDLQIKWDYVETLPEFAKLKDCQQNPKWHSEGTAWQHTVKCVNAAQGLLSTDYSALGLRKKRILLASVLFHDIGKGATTEFLKGNWHSYNHEFAGEKIARRMLWDEEFTAREEVCAMIRWHMEVLRVAESKDYINKILKISCNYFFNWRDAIFVKTCDCLGSQPEDPRQTDIDKEKLKFLTHACINLNCYELSLYAMDRLDRRRLFGKEFDWSNPYSFSTKPRIYVLIGLPGAGKDTFIKHFKEIDAISNDTVVLCRDDIRTELGYCKEGDKIIGTAKEETEVSRVFNKRFFDNIAKGENIILNNINLKKAYREDFHKKLAAISVKDKYEWVYVYVEAPTLADNIKRRDGQIDATAFDNIIEKFDWPTADEYDEIIIQKQEFKNEQV